MSRPYAIIKFFFFFIFNSSFRRKFLEKKRLKNLDRFKKGSTTLLNKKTYFVDSASFLSAYEQIFEQEIYKFRSDSRNPKIIDCGANIGLAILYWKHQFPEADIVAFEPDPKIYEVLYGNCKAHNHDDVKLIPKGVWKNDGIISFYQEGADGGYLLDAKEKKGERTITVPVTRLKKYLKGETIDLLKVDIEGSENSVLVDCEDVLHNVENIFLEYHSFVNQEQHLDQILRILKSSGFRYHLQPELVARNPFIERLNKNGMDHRVNIFAYRK